MEKPRGKRSGRSKRPRSQTAGPAEPKNARTAEPSNLAGKKPGPPAEKVTVPRVEVAKSIVDSEDKSTSHLRLGENGTAHLRGCDVPIWRLVMAERAGSTFAALIEAFPGLTSEALEAARRYAVSNPEEVESLIRKYGPKKIRQVAEPDDAAGFESELSEIVDRDAELYRRLAR
jgi:uncharacterized protein (DUF433 family)